MSNGNIFREIKEILKVDPNSLTIEARDRLVLEGIVQLHERIDEMTRVANRVTTGDLQKLEKHETTLYGNDRDERGLVKDVQDIGKDIQEIKKFISETKSDIRKIMWSVLAPVLAVIGVGIVVVIYLGFTLGQ